jgi:hypothetical protein
MAISAHYSFLFVNDRLSEAEYNDRRDRCTKQQLARCALSAVVASLKEYVDHGKWM